MKGIIVKKNQYCRPQSSVIYYEERLLDGVISQWTDEPFGKDTDFEDDDESNDDVQQGEGILSDHINKRVDDYRNGSWKSF